MSACADRGRLLRLPRQRQHLDQHFFGRRRQASSLPDASFAARRAVASALTSAPTSSARVALSTRCAAAATVSPALSASSAASSHHGPGSPGCARSIAGNARPASVRGDRVAGALREPPRECSAWRNLKSSPSTSMSCSSTPRRRPVDHGIAIDLCDRGKQVPVESPPEHRGGVEDDARAARSSVASRWRIESRKLKGTAGLSSRGRCPSVVVAHEVAGRHEPGEQFLHQERVAVAVGCDEGHDVGRRFVGRRGTRPRHAAMSFAPRAATSMSACGSRRCRRGSSSAVAPDRARREHREHAARCAGRRSGSRRRRASRRPPSAGPRARGRNRSSRRARCSSRTAASPSSTGDSSAPPVDAVAAPGTSLRTWPPNPASAGDVREWRRAECRGERLDERAVGDRCLPRDGAALEHRHAAVARAVDDLAAQPGLAGARLADQTDDATFATRRGVDALPRAGSVRVRVRQRRDTAAPASAGTGSHPYPSRA